MAKLSVHLHNNVFSSNDGTLANKVHMLPSAYIARFPREIVDDIFSHISIDECRNILKAYGNLHHRYRSTFTSAEDIANNIPTRYQWYNKLWSAVQYRADIHTYLGNYFPDSEQLLKYMLLNDVHLSGSRALDFFTGDAVDSNSDWDFYIPKKLQKIINFMEYMKKNNVVWQSTAQYVEEKINSNEKEIVMLPKHLDYVLQTSLWNSCTQETKSILQELRNKLREAVRERSREWHSGKQTIILNITNAQGVEKQVTMVNGYYGTFDAIEGRLYYKNSSTKIQLILVPDTPLVSFLDFHASIVQCYINGFSAVHMYKSTAYSRSSKSWNTSYSDTTSGKEKTKESVQKYKKRGYKFELPSCSYILPNEMYKPVCRHIGDPECETIIFKLSSSIFEDEARSSSAREYIQEKIKLMYDFSWIERSNVLQEDYFKSRYRHEYKVKLTDQLSKSIADAIIGSNTFRHTTNTDTRVRLEQTVKNTIVSQQVLSINSDLLKHVESKYDQREVNSAYYRLFEPLGTIHSLRDLQV